uniref:Uncharacterized protein n=1 Tax=Romanomermis culicivorax TaxID=13658 RepID=A0A915JBX8_ROMCU
MIVESPAKFHRSIYNRSAEDRQENTSHIKQDIPGAKNKTIVEVRRDLKLDGRQNGMGANELLHKNLLFAYFNYCVSSTILTKELPIIIPHEYFIELLLEPMGSENYMDISRAHIKLISRALRSFYDKLSIDPQAYHNSFESYVLGLLLSGNSLELGNERIEAFQFCYNEPLISKFVATVVLTSNVKSKAILFNMIQARDNMNFNVLKNYLHTHNVNLPPNIEQVESSMLCLEKLLYCYDFAQIV